MLSYADVTEHAKTTAKLGTALVGGLTGMLGFAVGQFVDQLVDPQSGIRKRARTIVDNSLDQRLIAALTLAKAPPDYAFKTLSGPERATGEFPPTIPTDLAAPPASAAPSHHHPQPVPRALLTRPDHYNEPQIP